MTYIMVQGHCVQLSCLEQTSDTDPSTLSTPRAMEENEHPVWAELRDMQAHERVSAS